MAQTPTLVKQGAYLQQQSTLSTNLLRDELQLLLGPVTYTAVMLAMPVESSAEPKPSPYWEGTAPILGDAWYMDGSSREQPAQW